MNFNNCYAVDPHTREIIDWQLRYAWLLDNERPRADLEHYVVKWNIENIGLLPAGGSKCIFSPSFRLESSRTVWIFKLATEISQNGEYKSSYSLQRLRDQGPQTVNITYRFGIENAENDVKWLGQKKKLLFEEGEIDECHWQTWDSSLTDVTQENDVLVVACEIYLSYVGLRCLEDPLSIADYDLVNLSADLLKLMRAKETCDYCIKLGNYEVIVHKAVLAARSPVFNKILKDDRHTSRYELPNASFTNITNLLLFMYSGDFGLVSRNGPPDIGFYECAVEYSLEDLAALLWPNYLNLRTELQRHEIEFTWHIENLKERFASPLSCVRSPPFKCAHSRSPEWSLVVHSRKNGSHHVDMDVSIEPSTVIDVLHSVLDISLIDDDGNREFTRSSTQKYHAGLQCGFRDFVKGFSIDPASSSYLSANVLKVHCRFEFVLSAYHVLDHALVPRSDTRALSSYSRLSRDLLTLFASGDFTDVSIRASNIVLRAHRSVLIARSRLLTSRPNADRGDVVDVSDVDPIVVWKMVKHAYSGVIGGQSSELLVKLLRASERYGFASLSLMCVQLLGRNISVANFFELLALARRTNNVALVEKCLAFARRNARSVLADAEWLKWKGQERQTYELLVQGVPELAEK